MLWLLAFMGVAAMVIARQTRAHVLAGELQRVRERHRVLDAERAELINAIQQASSRETIERKAAAMGLRVATGAEVVILRAPSADSAGR